jgi:isocitrate dehydrogenase
VILSAVMMLQYIGWDEAAGKIIDGLQKAVLNKTVTYDFARLMKDATEVSCSGFGTEIIKNMG